MKKGNWRPGEKKGKEGAGKRTENQYEQSERNTVEVASGEGRKVGNRVRRRRRASRTESMAAGRNLLEATWGLEVVRGPAGVGRARVLRPGRWVRGRGPGEALSIAPGGPGRLPSSTLPLVPTTSFRRKRCSLIRIIYKIMVHCLH